VALSDVLSVPAFYRWFRDEFPGGKIAAPVVVWVAIIAFLTLAGGIIWNGLGSPLTNYVRGVTPSIPIGQTIVAVTLVAVFVGAITWLMLRVNRLVKRIDAGAHVMAALAHSANTEVPRVDTRIDELDARLTKRIEALEAGQLRRIEPTDDDPFGSRALGKSMVKAMRSQLDPQK
jgi:hypothetical protein